MLRIAKSLITVIAVAAIAVGATGAIFTDTVTSHGNSVTSGTLTLTVNGTHSPSAVFSATNMHPLGISGWGSASDAAPNAGGVALKNTGSIKGHAWLEITNIVTSGGNGDGSLANRVKPVFALNGPSYGYLPTVPANASINQLNGVKVDVKDLDPNETINFVIYELWPDMGPAIDNLAQGQTVTYDVVFHLDQI
jgi:hypothetical protein